MRKLFWLCIFIYFFSEQAVAQSKKLTQQYQKAKTFLENKDYQEAILAFDPLLKKSKSNIYQAYAHFYSALCFFHLKKWKEAEKLLEKLSENFPQWEKMQAVLYLQANIAFENKEDNIALSYIAKIKDNSLKNKAEAMKAYYLGKRELSVLKNLQAVYSEDKTIAQILVDKLAAEVDNIKDLDLLEELVQKYALNKPEKIRLQRIERKIYRKKSDTVFVGIFLPINFIDFKDPSKKRSPATNLSVDLYQGMRIAKALLDSTLRKPTRLLVYDVYQNPDTLEAMYRNNEFAKIDLFVGPFYDEDFAKALEIAEKKDIPIINPFLTNTKFFKSKNAYFLQPSLETQGRQSARFAINNFGKNVIIFHSELPEETKLLNAHKAEIELQGGKILHQHKISVTTIPQIEEILSSPNYKEVSYVLVTSASQAAAERILQTMKEHLPNVPILTTMAWRKIPELKPIDLEKQNVYFIDPDYTRLSGDRDPFRVEYNQKVKDIFVYSNMSPPPVASHKGYDIIVSFVKYLHLYPQDFYQKIIESEDFKRTFRGYLFTDTERDNQYVPILKFVDKKLVVANPLTQEPIEPKYRAKK